MMKDTQGGALSRAATSQEHSASDNRNGRPTAHARGGAQTHTAPLALCKPGTGCLTSFPHPCPDNAFGG